ncbi:hypothetical protein BGZ83_009696 [Gryganskiella cystojenkinii]|nr:hypothetical protein BGZ83_009696 [Gryganskiella cystojenkinii]
MSPQLNLRHYFHRQPETSAADSYLRSWDESDTEAVLCLFNHKKGSPSKTDIETLATTTGQPVETVLAFINRWKILEQEAALLEHSLHEYHTISLSKSQSPEPFISSFDTSTRSSNLSSSSFRSTPLTLSTSPPPPALSQSQDKLPTKAKRARPVQTPLTCDVCHEQFFSKEGLTRHSELHGPKLPSSSSRDGILWSKRLLFLNTHMINMMQLIESSTDRQI